MTALEPVCGAGVLRAAEVLADHNSLVGSLNDVLVALAEAVGHMMPTDEGRTEVYFRLAPAAVGLVDDDSRLCVHLWLGESEVSVHVGPDMGDHVLFISEDHEGRVFATTDLSALLAGLLMAVPDLVDLEVSR